MSNILEFYIKMKDMMSGGLANLAKTSKQTFTKMKSDIADAHKNTKAMAHSIDELKAKLQQVNRVRTGTVLRDEFKQATREAKALQGEINRLEQKANGGGSLIRKLAPYAAAAAIFSGAMAFSKASIAQYADFEKSTKTYQVLTGNKGIGTAVAGGLNDLKQNSILGTSVYPTAQMLMAFGDRADKVLPHIKMLGDVSMGDADKLHRLAYAFGEVESSGRLTGRQLMQMTNAGFNPLREISKATGDSIEVLREKMRKGEITFKQVEKAFESATGKGGMFHDMMNQMADTTSGKVLMLKGKIAALEIALGERLAPAFKWATDKAMGFVGWIKKLVEIPVESKLQSEIDKIRGLQAELTSSNTSHQRQVELLHELEQINPHIVEGIKAQSIEYGKLRKNIDDVVGSLNSKIAAEQFNKDFAPLLKKQTNLTGGIESSYGKVQSIVGRYLPESMLGDRNMTDAQKQAATLKTLFQIVGEQQRKKNKGRQFGQQLYSWHTNSRGTRGDFKLGTPESDALILMQDEMFINNNLVKQLKKITPDLNDFNRRKGLLQKSLAGTEVKQMVASDIKNNPGKYKGVGGEGDGDGSAGDVSKGITGGGPKTINIHIGKMVEKIEVNSIDAKGAYNDIEHKVEEIFLRVLNSGATIQ